MTPPLPHAATATQSLNDLSLKQLLGLLFDLKLRQAELQIFTVPNWTYILWLFCGIVSFLFLLGFIVAKIFGLNLFYSAFQTIKLKHEDIEHSLKENT